MVIQVEKTRKKRANRFMSTEEAKILWQASKRWGTKWQIMVGLALFRGMRIGEICACNIYDFNNSNFNKLNIILSKSHIQDEFPILAEFNLMIKEYIMTNKHTMKDGYLFPFYSSKKKSSHIHPKSAEALFSKLRQIIGRGVEKKKNKEYRFPPHPEFLEKDRPGSVFYRIGWHSCRRWFETTIWEKYKDKMMLRDIMRYTESKTVDVYIDSYKIWKEEGRILDDTFGDLFSDFNNISRGQTKLTAFT